MVQILSYSRAEVCALTHIAVGSDLRECVIYNNDDKGEKKTYLQSRDLITTTHLIAR